MTYVTEKDFAEMQKVVQALTESVKALTTGGTTPPPDHSDARVTHTPVAQLAHLNNQVSQLHNDLEEQKKRNSEMQQEREYREIENFVDQQIRDRRILPKDRSDKIELLKVLPVAPSYSESGSVKEKSARQMMMESIERGPQLWSSGEMPSGSGHHTDPYTEAQIQAFSELGTVDNESLVLDQKVREFAKEAGLSPNAPDFDYADAYTRYCQVYGVAG